MEPKQQNLSKAELIFMTISPVQQHRRDYRGQRNPVPPKHHKRVRLNITQQPSDRDERYDCRDNKAQEHHVPVLRFRAWWRMMQRLKDLPAARSQHRWDSHQETVFRRRRTTEPEDQTK